jgi:hypothetical protein
MSYVIEFQQIIYPKMSCSVLTIYTMTQQYYKIIIMYIMYKKRYNACVNQATWIYQEYNTVTDPRNLKAYY